MATPGKDMTDAEGRNEFHRAIALQYECVSDLLREFLDCKLSKNSISLKTYLGSCRVHLSGKKYVTYDQNELLHSPNPDSKDFDVSMLTLVLLTKCNNRINVTRREQNCIERLREHRNTLAHNISGRLKDSKLFVETSNDVMDLAKSLNSTIKTNLKACIDELKQRACVRIHSKLEVLQFNTEQLQVILSYKDDNGEVTDETTNETVLRFNLSKWSKQISRGIDMNKMLAQLRKPKIFSTELLRRISDTEYEYNKAVTLIEYLIKEGGKIEILQFCKLLRDQERCTNLADLIEGMNTDGYDTMNQLKKFEEKNLTKVLQDCIETDEHGNETCEAVHSYVQEMMDNNISFTFLNNVMKTTFGCSEKDGRFEGVVLTKATNADCNVKEIPDGGNVNIAAMSLQQYAQYIGNEFLSIGDSICENITRALKEECVQIDLFVDLTAEQLDELFCFYLECKTLKFGIKTKLQRLQKAIKKQLVPEPNDTEDKNPKYLLREFDRPFHAEYPNAKEVIYTLGGNKNVPAHEFIHIESSTLGKYDIVKKTLKFISACLNARKNGTIHFGIKRTGRNTGQIVGISKKSISLSVDGMVLNGICKCFGHLGSSLQRNVIRCTRPAHIIKILHEDLVVVEIDVVPFHKHVDDSFYTLMFPPCGPQTETFFLYQEGPGCDIGVIENDRIEATKKELVESLRDRQILDDDTLCRYRSVSDRASKLTYELTRGADYITDVFYPVICVGNMTTVDILNHHGLQDAFQNSFAVFDFGSSTTLRKQMEGGSPIFTVKTTLDFDSDENEISFSDKEIPWIYCNGNDDIGIEVLDANNWTDQRMIPLENVLRYLKTKIPRSRAKIIFLAFEVYGCKDPMVMFARETFIRIFKHQCIVIGENHDVLEPFEDVISCQIGKEKVNEHLFSGLTWYNVAKVFRKTFKESTETVCKLPNSSGTYDELSHKEKEKWKDINILNMEECINDEKQMKENERKIKRKEEETKFYQGKQASWWNFYYGHHGERDLFSKLRSSIENKLTRVNGVMIVETVEVQHEPGAGGSIFGRHLIWHFSQSRCIREPYRCCVVKHITENTVREIEEFRQYNDTTPRPVIILLDDEPDGNMLFRKGLQQLAYKTASPGELFGLVINVSRISLRSDLVEEAEDGKIEVKNSLKHRLTEREKVWFENKYKELENSDVDVNTLIAFNVMRNSFDKNYIRSTVDVIMNEVSVKETDVFKVLSLVSTYEIGTLVPHSIFDSLIGIPITTKKSKFGQVGEGKPYGLRPKRGKHSQPPEILNSQTLSLFVCRSGYELKTRGLRIISQPLAEVILNHIQEKLNLSLEDIVLFIIDMIQKQSSKDSTDSKRFVEVVCSLFKTREDSGKGKDGFKDKFSRLILALYNDGIDSVVRVMDKCIDITKDAFVGQQLARFHISTKDFTAAEQAICDSIILCPNNSYLLDTYGQVFKTNMEYLKEKNCKGGQKMSNDIAKEIIVLAFKALDMFAEGQLTTQMYEKERCNLSCYYMEVRTLVGLLEMFESFDCFTNDDDLLEVLNSPDADFSRSWLAELIDDGVLRDLSLGGNRQKHADDVLRFVEEGNYQVKKIYTIYTSEDALVLTLRERYERFYRSHGLKYQLKFGYGLKPLLKAMKSKNQTVVQHRYLEAKMNLEKFPLAYADGRDLLFFIGYSFIQLLSNETHIDPKHFRQLLSYSAKLFETQKDEHRPYLEAFLYYAIFHWPLKGRFVFDNLSSPNAYLRMMELWEESYLKNNYITNREQMKANKGKTYFALSKDHVGVIDLFEIEMEWRGMKEKEGRSRMHVYKDYFWREPVVAERLERLTGTLDDSGTMISHLVEYPKGHHVFMIKAFYPAAQLRNRQVTFVLAFTWSGLRAFDVVEKCDSSHSNGRSDVRKTNESDAKTKKETDKTQGRTYQPNEQWNAWKSDVNPQRRNYFNQQTPKDVNQPAKPGLGKAEGQRSPRRNTKETSQKRSILSKSDLATDQLSRVSENFIKQKSPHSKPTEIECRKQEEHQSPRQQTMETSPKRSNLSHSDLASDKLSRVSAYLIKQKSLHRKPIETECRQQDDEDLISLSEFPMLVKNDPAVDNKSKGHVSTYGKMSSQKEHLPNKEVKEQSSSNARPRQNLDYASIASKGSTGTKSFKRNVITEGTEKALTPEKVDLASPNECCDNEYWDQLQKSVMTEDWDTKATKNKASAGHNEGTMQRQSETKMDNMETIKPEESKPINVEGEESQTKTSKKKKKKKKKKKTELEKTEAKPCNTDKQFFDELD